MRFLPRKQQLAAAAIAALAVLAFAAPARADGYPITQAAIIAPGGDCTTVACTSASKYLCRNSATSTGLYACNTTTHLYVAVAGGATPGGAASNVQYNTGAALGGDGGLTYDSTNRILGVTSTNANALTNYSSSGGTLRFTDFKADLTIANAAAPTLGTTFTSLGGCRSDTTYEVGIVACNPSGCTAPSGNVLTWTPSSGNANRATINKPSLPGTATAWACAFAKSSESYSTWRQCTSPAADNILPTATTSVILNCNGTTTYTNTNTTGPATIASLYDGQWRLPSVTGNADADDPRQTAGQRLINLPAVPITSTGSYQLATVDLAQTWNAQPTFGVGAGVGSGQKMCLDGNTCATYLTKDADSGCVQEYQAGALQWQLCGSYVVPPPCSSTVARPLGGYCREVSTAGGFNRILMQTRRGTVDLDTGRVVPR